jgi:CHAT domain-containing protein/lipopolysaccharide biosynthesis regulator YciM
VAHTQILPDTTRALQSLAAGTQLILEKGNYTDSVAIHLNIAKSLFTKENNWERYIKECLRLVQIVYTKGFYLEGIRLLQQLEQDVTEAPSVLESQKIEIKYQIGRGYYFLKEYDVCIQLSEANLSKLVQSTDSTTLVFANHYNLIGVCNEGKGLYQKALSFYEKTLAIRVQALGNQHDLVASILNNIGNVYRSLGLYTKSSICYNQSLTIREKTLGKNNPAIATVLLNIGALYRTKGEYNKSIQFYERALSIFQANSKDFEVRIADIFNNLAITYKNKGSYQESTSYHQQAIQKYEQLPNDQSEKIANVYTNWANLAELQKNYDRAIELQQQAIELYSKNLKPVHPRILNAKNNQGINYYKNGEYDKALTQLQSLLPILEKDTTQRTQYANVCNDLADVYFKINNLPQAKAYNLKALAIQQQLFGEQSYRLAYTYNSLAQIEEAEGNQDAALQYLQRALAANHANFQATDIAAVPSPQGYYRYDYFLESLLHKARLLRQSPLRGSGGSEGILRATLLYQVADTVIQQVRNELLASEDKIRLSEKMYELSRAAIETYVQLAQATGDTRYWAQAFAYSEKTKANLLFQSLRVNQNKRFAGVPDSLLTLEEQLESDLNSLKVNLAETNFASVPPSGVRGQEPDKQRLLQDALFETQNKYGKLVEQLQQAYPAYFQLKYEQKLPDVRTIQESLPEATALVSYFTGDSVLYSFVLTNTSFKVYQTPIDKELYQEQILGLPKTIAGRLDADYIELAGNLYPILFPFKLNKNIKSILIVPDGALTTLPFETLLTTPATANNEIDFVKLPYLLNSYQISYAASASLYYQQRTNPPNTEASEGLLAYAPVFAETENLDKYNSSVRGLVQALPQSSTRMVTRGGVFIPPLPATATEVKAIATVFIKKGQPVKTYLFENANERQLKQSALQRSCYLHIATHGMVAEDQPDLSGLLLFPDTSAQGEDHILYSGEVYNLKLNAQLVTLSACETGLGKVANGEGLLGLSRAFQFAGAQNLVVSLWQVDDQATASLMQDFYQLHLKKEKLPFANPLRQAKLNMIRSGAKSHPYYWSAFKLIGK